MPSKQEMRLRDLRSTIVECFARCDGTGGMAALVVWAVLIAVLSSSGCERNPTGPESASRAQDEAAAERPESGDEPAGHGARKQEGTPEESERDADPDEETTFGESEPGDEAAGETVEGDESTDAPTLEAGATDDGRVVFDPLDGAGLDRDKLDAAFKKFGGTRQVDYESVREDGAEGLEGVEVLTSDGPERLSIELVQRVGRPDGYDHKLLTEASEALDDPPDWLLVAPVGQLSGSAEMRTPEAKPVHRKAAPKIKNTVLEQLDPEHRDEARTLDAEHMKAVDGRFPTPHAQFVMVNFPDATRPALRAIYLAEDTGEVSATVDDPFYGALGPVELMGLADSDGDGTDGVLYVVHFDGFFVRWLDFDDDGEPVVRTLAGFGA